MWDWFLEVRVSNAQATGVVGAAPLDLVMSTSDALSAVACRDVSRTVNTLVARGRGVQLCALSQNFEHFGPKRVCSPIEEP
jgi:hypothetical protein